MLLFLYFNASFNNKGSYMSKCKACGKKLPMWRSQRNWLERHITHRKKLKYECEDCKKLTLYKDRGLPHWSVLVTELLFCKV